MRNIQWIKALINKTAQNEPRWKQNFQNLNLLASVITIALIVGDTSNWRRSIENYKQLAAYIKKRFKVFLTLNSLIREIVTILESDHIFTVLFPNSAPLIAFASDTNKQINQFITHITRTMHVCERQPFANIGNILYLLPEFLHIKDQFGSLFQSLGTIESLISTARLIEEHKNSTAPWSFAIYEVAPRPHIAITDYKHPMLPIEKAVLNSIELGSTKQQGLIITGPNASGKSMTIRSIVIALLLSQSLTIAPAKHMTLTPMHKILTYLNPVDSISNNRSLFQAEEDRILSIINQIYYLPPTKFSFVAADELLSSTAPTEGEAATFGICYGLAKLPGCIPIMATHFGKLTALPQHTNNFYANYHVSVIKDPAGTILHTFKLEPGISHQIIALDLARIAGFDNDILNCAETFLREAENTNAAH